MFLKREKCLFSLSVEMKKKIKINVLMSKAIKSRTPIQCHTHHQKMIKKYESIEEILKNY